MSDIKIVSTVTKRMNLTNVKEQNRCEQDVWAVGLERCIPASVAIGPNRMEGARIEPATRNRVWFAVQGNPTPKEG